jgi:hypothetical protein
MCSGAWEVVFSFSWIFHFRQESQFRDNAGGEVVFEAQSNSNGREPWAAERDADVENEPVAIPAGESMVITEIWQDRYRRVQNSHTL